MILLNMNLIDLSDLVPQLSFDTFSKMFCQMSCKHSECIVWSWPVCARGILCPLLRVWAVVNISSPEMSDIIVCAACNENIEGKAMKAKDNCFHEHHFICSHEDCGINLVKLPVYTKYLRNPCTSVSSFKELNWGLVRTLYKCCMPRVKFHPECNP